MFAEFEIIKAVFKWSVKRPHCDSQTFFCHHWPPDVQQTRSQRKNTKEKVQILAQIQLGKQERLKQPWCSYTEAALFSGEKQAKISTHTHTQWYVCTQQIYSGKWTITTNCHTQHERVCLSVSLVKYKHRNWHSTKCTINIQRFPQVQIKHKQICILRLSHHKMV